MAFSKKNKRKIVVRDRIYYWSAVGDNGGISVWVMADLNNSPKIKCRFRYHQEVKERFETPYGVGCSLHNQFVVTPYTVRQVIELALMKGWRPDQKGADIHLGYIDA